LNRCLRDYDTAQLFTVHFTQRVDCVKWGWWYYNMNNT